MIEVKLKELLEKKGITISELSRETGIARSTITPIVNDPEEVKSIRFVTLDTLCEYLNCQLTDIIDYKPNKENFHIENIYELTFQNDNLLMVYATKETSFSSVPAYLSIYGDTIHYSEGEEVYDSDAFRISIEVMNENEIKKVAKELPEFVIEDEQLSILDKSSIEIRSWLNNLDRESLRSLTIKIFSKIVELNKYELKEDIRITWTIGSKHFDTLRHSFEFEVDYENRLMRDVSNYNSLHNKPVSNFNFL